MRITEPAGILQDLTHRIDCPATEPRAVIPFLTLTRWSVQIRKDSVIKEQNRNERRLRTKMNTKILLKRTLIFYLKAGLQCFSLQVVINKCFFLNS